MPQTTVRYVNSSSSELLSLRYERLFIVLWINMYSYATSCSEQTSYDSYPSLKLSTSALSVMALGRGRSKSTPKVSVALVVSNVMRASVSDIVSAIKC